MANRILALANSIFRIAAEELILFDALGDSGKWSLISDNLRRATIHKAE